MKHNICQIIDSLQDLHYTGGVDLSLIKKAEKQLGVEFAPEYILYLGKYGQIEATGIELTGLSNKTTTSVVYATNLLRKFGHIPYNMYVIEDLGVDGIEYLQDKSGIIYQYAGRNSLSLYALSLYDYIEKSKS